MTTLSPGLLGPQDLLDAGLSRRAFLFRSLASGFALASGAVQAQAISTSSEGLDAGEVRIPVAGGEIPGYRAQPAGPGPHPVLLVIQEIFGVHEHIRDLCRRYARQGYYAIAPELFTRQGDVSGLKDIPSIISSVVSKVPDAQVMADLDATVAHARANGAHPTRLGMVGFCWGGRIVWLYGVHNPQVQAGVAYYGMLGGTPSPIKPENPLDAASRLKVPVLGLYAANDSGIPLESVEKMRGLLAAGSSGSRIEVFPGVAHGFNADYRPSYDRAAATRAATLAAQWLKELGA